MQINTFSFDINGLKVQYNNTTFLTLCPKATVSLLEDMGQIEAWEIDANGEPVILYYDEAAPHGYDGEPWHLFVKSFYLNERIIAVLMSRIEDVKASVRTQIAYEQARVIRLNNNLQTAA